VAAAAGDEEEEEEGERKKKVNSLLTPSIFPLIFPLS